MKKLLVLALAAGLFGPLSSCKKSENDTGSGNEQEETPTTKVPVSGHYVWEFEIPGLGSQLSHLIFYTDSIGYIMEGAAYSTIYTMHQDQYTEKGDEKRWIGIGKGGSIPKDGAYFLMFFKDITDSTVTVYKRECKEGKEEAETFAYPAADATEDHGWNVYHKK